MLYEAIIIGVVAGWLARGRLANLAKIKLSAVWLVFLAFIIQWGMDLLWTRGFTAMDDYRLLFYGVSYALLLIFLWKHRRLPGIKVLALGFALNFLVIGVNGGAMPVTIDGLDPGLAQLLEDKGVITYSMITEQTRLPWLADTLIFPWPKAKAFSIGDIFISLGVFWLVFKSMTVKRFPEKLTSVRTLKI